MLFVNVINNNNILMICCYKLWCFYVCFVVKMIIKMMVKMISNVLVI